MSLFLYIIDLPGEVGKEGRMTAKTEKEAKEKISEKYPMGQNLILEAESSPSNKVAKTATKKTSAKKAAAKGLSKLEKYLYLQHGKCFFCGANLTRGSATIEHLNPISKGGKRTEDNEVASCASVNHAFGDMDLKRKFEFVLRASNSFRCPTSDEKTTVQTQAGASDQNQATTTPENHGLPWTEVEEKQLLSRFAQKLDLNVIAHRHKRGIGAVRARLVKLGKIEDSG
jgi:hypothetical protein